VIVKIQPSNISGTLVAATSKSSMQRALAAALLTNGETTILNPGRSNDDKAAIEIITALGADVVVRQEQVIVNSFGVFSRSSEINCGESGLAVRMFTPIIALCDKEITINGEGSLLSRPIDFFEEVLPQLGVSIKSNKGKLPMTIKGPLQPKNIEVSGSLSSQFLTGLLFAYSALPNSTLTEADEMMNNDLSETVCIKVHDLKSKPYIDLTLDVMKKFGMDLHLTNNNHETFCFYREPGVERRKGGGVYTVEGDWSGVAFLLVAGAIAGGITVKGLDVFSTQADKAILKALMDCGTSISIEEKQITINSSLASAGKAFHFNATDCPDLFPPLVALAAYCNGTTVIEGVSRLAHKESNRAITLQQEFLKMGIEIKLQDDLMMIKGGEGVKGAKVHSRHDHRIAMACAVAALGATGETIIEDAEAVNKSYPAFFDDLKLLNASVSLQVNELTS